MTCIVGIIDKKDKKIIIGGDSAGAAGYAITLRRDTKVFIKDNRFIIGFTSSFRMGQILHYNRLVVEEQEECEDNLAFMVKKFVPAVQALFDAHGWDKRYSDGEKSGGVFLVGYKDSLFKIESDFQVGESFKCYTACGCGEDFALGSLFSTTKMEPEERVSEALRAAQEFSAGVRQPFIVKSLSY